MVVICIVIEEVVCVDVFVLLIFVVNKLGIMGLILWGFEELKK